MYFCKRWAITLSASCVYLQHRMYSELISAAIASGGPHAARTSAVKLMRAVKKATLRLIETFVDKCEDTQLIATQFVPAMMDPILGDYARNVPDARWGALAECHLMSQFLLLSLCWPS